MPFWACVRHDFEFGGQRHEPIVGGDEILLLGFLAEFLAGRFHLPGEHFEFGAEVVGDDAGFVDADWAAMDLWRTLPLPARLQASGDSSSPVEEVGEEVVGQVAAAIDLLLLFRAGRGGRAGPCSCGRCRAC